MPQRYEEGDAPQPQDASDQRRPGSRRARRTPRHAAPRRRDTVASGVVGMTGGAGEEPRNPLHATKSMEQAVDDAFGLRDMLVWCGVPVLVMLLLRLVLFGCYMIPSGSMLDTIELGDRVVTSKLSPRFIDLQRGDIIVFHDPANWLSSEKQSTVGGDYLIKRLIGMPGDTVSCAGAGEPITVNGVAVDESAYLKPGVDPSAFPFSVTVTEGHVFVMGDNRANSADSRYHQNDGANGLVPIDDVVGVAVARYWPLDRISLLSGHHDVFADVPDATASGSAGSSGSSVASAASGSSGPSDSVGSSALPAALAAGKGA
ncbi:signal peptidase I [Bifidobacterium samirii]|uniref:Signal peptidase I n=1 Tax=Bifidobacterium samirii TaxID=2306974 RepID=A0A430FR65_9BIFI|nr:signal peptidase I [Bifidobacterium samirii]RSX55343.1 signal peptidase [Bifidobacterium samirii]